MTTKTFNFAPVRKMVEDELHGTGLEFSLVVWRPGLPGGIDSVVALGFGGDDAQAALRMAAQKLEES